MDKTKLVSSFVISIFFSVFLISLIFNYIDVSKLHLLFKQIELKYYLISFLIYIVINLLIALRLIYFFKLNLKLKFRQCFDVGVFHAVALCVLPLRLGDAVYPFLVKRFLSKSLVNSLHNLLVLRIYDFFSAAMLFMGILFYSVILPSVPNLVYLLLICSAFICFIIINNITAVISVLIKILEKFEMRKVCKKLKIVLHEFNQNVSRLSGISHFNILVFSLSRWILSGLMLLFICKALNINFQFEQTLYLTTGMNMAFILPLQTVGGIGLLESVLVFLMTLLQQPIDNASTFAISMRILWFAMPFLLAGLWFFSGLMFKKYKLD